MPTYRVNTGVYAVVIIGRQASGGSINNANFTGGPDQGNVGLLDQYVQQQLPYVVPVEEVAAGGDESKSDADAGLGTDSVTQAQTVTDTGSGSDNATVRITVTDTGSGLDAVTQRQTVTDTGAGADASTLAVALALTDTGAGADTAAAEAEDVQVVVSDSGGGEGTYGGEDTYGGGFYASVVDVAQRAVIGITVSDSGAASDSSWLYDGNAVQASVSDVAAGLDAITQAQAISDTGSGSDAAVIRIFVWDAHSAYGVGTYGTGTFAIDPSAVETAAGGEVSPITPTGDSAQGSDTSTLAGATAGTDNGVGSDAATIAVAVPVADTGTVLEAITSSAALAVAELAAAVDAIFIGPVATDEGSGLEGTNVTEQAPDLGRPPLSSTYSVHVVAFTGSARVLEGAFAASVTPFTSEVRT